MPRVLVARDFCGLLEADQFGLAGIRWQEWMDLQIAETSGKRHVLRRCHRLIPEEDHLVVVERLTQFRDDFVVEFGREVYAGDLGTSRGAQLASGKTPPLQASQTIT